jgi:uncharacterized membrane protein
MEDRKFVKNAILIGLFSWALIALVIWMLTDLSIAESGYAAITPVIMLSVLSLIIFGVIVKE